VNTAMHVLSRVTLSSMSFGCRSCGDLGRVLPTSVEVAVFLRILAARASVIRIHSSCQGVSVRGWGNSDIVAGFARATLPQEGITHESPKSTQPDPKAKLQPDSEDEDSPT